MNRRLILILTLIIISLIALFVYFGTSKKTSDTNGSFDAFRNLLPFGSAPQNIDTPNNTPLIIGTQNNTDTNNRLIPKLRHYTTEPTAGSVIIEREKDVIKERVKIKELGYYIRYIDRATGHIYESKTTEDLVEKISNTTIPKIYEATFLPSGTSLITRFLDKNEQIITYYITLKDKPVSTSQNATSTPTVNDKNTLEKNTLKDATGIYLTQDIKEIAISPSGNKILESIYGINGGIFSLLDGNQTPRTILTHALRDWLLTIPNETNAVITTKPSGVAFGYAYILNLQTGGLKRVIGDVVGLTVLPYRDLTTYLIGKGGNEIQLKVMKKNKEVVDLSFNTLPEKCVWAKQAIATAYCAVPTNKVTGIFPDDWYKGKVSFTDSIWKINTETGETSLVSDLSKESGHAIDVINLQISNNDTYLTFINKKDLTLWGMDLTIK